MDNEKDVVERLERYAKVVARNMLLKYNLGGDGFRATTGPNRCCRRAGTSGATPATRGWPGTG